MNPPGIETDRPRVAILHYSAPPVVGGVEAVIAAHVGLFRQRGYPVTVIAGRGEPPQSEAYGRAAAAPVPPFILVPEMHTQHPEVRRVGQALEAGIIPDEFERLTEKLASGLAPYLSVFDRVIVHNIFTKHFNLPLTAALVRLLKAGMLRGCIAWCHDLTWTSPNSRSLVRPGFPWDFLRMPLPEVTYVAVSDVRRQELAGLLGCRVEMVRVITNGVDPQALLGLTTEGWTLAQRLDLPDGDPVLLMPVRVTQAKNIEYALQVTAALKTAGRQPRLIVTGPPDPHEADSLAYYRSLQELRRQLDLEGEMRFVFESGPDPGQPYRVDFRVVGDLLRLSDAVFLPSHREGFGMPVLEAGLAGTPVISAMLPAAQEIGGEDVLLFDRTQPAPVTARQILAWLDGNPLSRLRRRVRCQYTWEAIFRGQIEPLLQGNLPPTITPSGSSGGEWETGF